MAGETLELGSVMFAPADTVHSLTESAFDSHISMAAQVNSVISWSYYQIHQLGTIRKYISGSTCLKVVLALVTSRLDYCNVFLNVIPGYQMDILQRFKTMLHVSSHGAEKTATSLQFSGPSTGCQSTRVSSSRLRPMCSRPAMAWPQHMCAVFGPDIFLHAPYALTAESRCWIHPCPERVLLMTASQP